MESGKLLYSLTLLVFAISHLTALSEELSSVTPARGVTESIGAYTAGCMRNSAALPMNGEGFQVIRPGRGRFYANPETVEFIIELGKKVSEDIKGVILIGDVAQKTGGPMPEEHSSHQTGLDADILYWQHPVALKRQLTPQEREHIFPQSVLNTEETGIEDFKWDDRMGEIVKEAASYGSVDRIFVNPIIKKRLCETYSGEPWLRKLRPWYGHDGHFHVRLKCPPGNTLCETQEPLNMFDDGCGSELDGWFTADGKIRRQKSTVKSVRPRLPDECVAIINGSR